MTDAQFNVEVRVGNLVEARVWRLMTRADTDAYGRAVIENAGRVGGGRPPVLCADHRPAAVYPPAAADRLVELFRPNNSRFDRIAILVGASNATLLLQLERLTREAGFSNRRVFREPQAAVSHLTPALDEQALARVREFLAEYP